MYLKEGQKNQINAAVRELKDLASMKNCALDADTKEKMRLWVMWIEVYANSIEDALEGHLQEKYL